MSADLKGLIPLGECPMCKSPLCPKVVKVHCFNCPDCGTLLMPDRGRAYFWLRICFGFGGALIWSWHRFHDSFMVFFAGFYAYPLTLLWFLLEKNLFPPRKFRRYDEGFVTLEIQHLKYISEKTRHGLE
jgi:hypothetical protein